jgi:hypothetical protein
MATGREKRRKKRGGRGKPDNPAQSKRFMEAAKALGVDESGKAFKDAMDKIAQKKSKDGSS